MHLPCFCWHPPSHSPKFSFSSGSQGRAQSSTTLTQKKKSHLFSAASHALTDTLLQTVGLSTGALTPGTMSWPQTGKPNSGRAMAGCLQSKSPFSYTEKKKKQERFLIFRNNSHSGLECRGLLPAPGYAARAPGSSRGWGDLQQLRISFTYRGWK